jgi:hypothetical protein
MLPFVLSCNLSKVRKPSPNTYIEYFTDITRIVPNNNMEILK